ncbi:Cytochrome b561 [Oryzias melastigma]|uniref:Transmembrane ascorbate-dependent reductase CYB561 n=1 Tax=Oryzias melastigma TaxID=30732 RepID=A0A834BZN4_ORYME|nr:Cytochrome b561 [Oryzias melastigma]
MGHYRGGFAWDGSAREFNLHPLCMVLGLVLLHGDGDSNMGGSSNRIKHPTRTTKKKHIKPSWSTECFSNEAKKKVKLLHGTIHLLALITSIVGVVAVFDFHSASLIPHLYSLHSWGGLTTLILFSLQWVMGLLFFLFPGASSWLRATYLPIHVFCGLTLLVMAIGTSLLGITEKLLFSIESSYPQFTSEGVLANILGVLLVLFGVLICYLVTREEYRRPPNPEEEALSVHFKTLTEGGAPATP